MIAARSIAVRAAPAPRVRAAPVRARVVVRSTPADIEKETAKALKNAEDVCKSGTTEVSTRVVPVLCCLGITCRT